MVIIIFFQKTQLRNPRALLPSPMRPQEAGTAEPGKESRTAKINHRDQPDTLHVAARRAEPARGARAGRAWGPAASACGRTARAQGRSGSRADKTRRAAPTRPALLHQSQPASKHPAPRRAPHNGLRGPCPAPAPPAPSSRQVKSLSAETRLLFREQLRLIAVNPLTRLWLTSGKPGAARVSPSGPGCRVGAFWWGGVFVSSWKLTKSCPGLSEQPERQSRGTGAPRRTPRLLGATVENRKGMRGSKAAPENFLENGLCGRTFASRPGVNPALASFYPPPPRPPRLFFPRVGFAKVCLCAQRKTNPTRGLE